MKNILLIIILQATVLFGQLLYENFEESVLNDSWIQQNVSYEFDEGANGTSVSLIITETSNHRNGLAVAFDSSNPSYISFYTKPPMNRDYANNYFLAGSGLDLSDQAIFMNLNECSGVPSFKIADSSSESHCYNPINDEWYFIEFKNINFSSYTFDWYINGDLQAASITFRYNVGLFNLIHIYNYNSSSYQNSWYDEICVGTESECVYNNSGCTEPSACNYDEDVTENDGSCEYAMENYDCDGNCLVDTDCSGECGGSAMEDECGVCGGDGSSCSGSAHLEIQNVNLSEGTLDIYMENDVDVYALQVVFTGLTDNCTSGCDNGIISVIPGEIVPDDWNLSGEDDEILGYNINMLAPISAGQGILATIIFADNISDDAICIPLQYNCTDGYNEDTCYLDLDGGGFSSGDDNPILSDAFANSIPVTVGNCHENDDNWVYGCTYNTATNYNPGATFDDGSCDFMWGDVNHDGVLTIQDLILIVNEILNF